MIEGACHCGAARWRFDGVPEEATACNCTLCRRYGVLWAYGYVGGAIDVSGPTRAYTPGQEIDFHFCETCANLVFWRRRAPGPDGRTRIAVNLRLAEPQDVADIPLEHLDGLNSWRGDRDGRRVKDLWF